jgi:hypothetical protein
MSWPEAEPDSGAASGPRPVPDSPRQEQALPLSVAKLAKASLGGYPDG